MAKALIALVLASLLVAGLAADTGRNLLQDYDCKAAKGIGKLGNACKLLCGCAAGLNSSLKPLESRCMDMCGKCKEAAEKQDCAKDPKLPAICNEGRNANPGGKEINQCISTYLKAQAGRH